MENNLKSKSISTVTGEDSSCYAVLNLRPSPVDHRDRVYQQTKATVRPLVDLTEWDSAVDSQGSLGSCTAHAVTNAFELLLKKLYAEQYHDLSTLFVYYHARLFENRLSTDSGAYIRDGLKAAKRYGVCKNSLWPYVESKFDVQPHPDCYVDASGRVVSSYEKLYTLTDLLEVLNANRPVVTGMRIYSGFYQVDQNHSVVPLPAAAEASIGAHAVTLVGYDVAQTQFLAKNSFGTDWGNGGYCWIPFDYMRMHAFENWCFDIAIK
jgi:C1A family cysteine protease